MDTLSSEIFKSAFSNISPFLVKLFNRLLERGEYPQKWGEGIIIPIFKGGDIEDPNKYRGVCLVNILGKIYSQILLNRITKWSQLKEKIINNQFGFQKGKSTTDCIFLLHAIIAKSLSVKQKVYTAFVDYEKCFDKIPRFLLWEKLLKENVSTKIVNALKAMYSVVKQCIRFNCQKSDFFESHAGVKQGDPSSSLLFLFFVNDVINNMNTDVPGLFTVDELKIFMLLFADDSALFATTPDGLQHLLNELEIYCRVSGIKINTDKTKIMIFEKGRSTRHNFILCNTELEIVDSFKYLGTHLFKNGSWYRTQKRLAQHSLFALHNLFIVFTQLELTTSDKCRLFDSLVGSILNYNAAVWGKPRLKRY